jgi:hypothetical protein
MLSRGRGNGSSRRSLAAALVLIALAVNGCKGNDVTNVVCGAAGTVQLSQTLTVSSPSFVLQTPPAFSGESCQAEYQLTFYWADAARATPRSWTFIPISLAQAFTVLSTDGLVGGYFVGGTGQSSDDWHVAEDDGVFTEYSVDFHDHNAGTTTSSVFSIKTHLTSNDPRDSLVVSGRIFFFAP